MRHTLSRISGRAPAAICRCGCNRLLLFLKLPPKRGEDPRGVRKVAVYAENWDGNPWFTGQCRRHRGNWGLDGAPWEEKFVPPDERLE